MTAQRQLFHNGFLTVELKVLTVQLIPALLSMLAQTSDSNALAV